jgi:hypothetical protein
MKRTRGAGREQQALDVLVEMAVSRDAVHKVHELGHSMTEIQYRMIKPGDQQSKSFRNQLL